MPLGEFASTAKWPQRDKAWTSTRTRSRSTEKQSPSPPDTTGSFSTSPPVSYATLVSAPLLHISAKAYAGMANAQAVPLNFDSRDVDAKTVKTAEVRDFLTSVTSSLLKSVDLNINLIGIPLGSVSAITSALLGVLSPLTAALDPVLGAVLDLIGVHLGEVDVQVHGIGCGNSVLAG